MNQEKTLAELAQGAEGFATLKVLDKWQTGLVFKNETGRYFGFSHLGLFRLHNFRLLNNGVKVGGEILAIPAAELKALLSEVENG